MTAEANHHEMVTAAHLSITSNVRGSRSPQIYSPQSKIKVR
jgi:hypothetical protein